jgi:hypothetical protein
MQGFEGPDSHRSPGKIVNAGFFLAIWRLSPATTGVFTVPLDEPRESAQDTNR